jgi:hypothetical protein
MVRSAILQAHAHVTFWRFAGREIAIGALQAVGGIALYALVIWAVVHKYINTQVLRNAVSARTAFFTTDGRTGPPEADRRGGGGSDWT